MRRSYSVRASVGRDGEWGRMVGTILSEMGMGVLGGVGVASMCVGTGMGLVVRE